MMIKRFALLIASISLLCCAVMPAVSAYAVAGADDVFQGVCSDPAAKDSSTCQTTGKDPLGGPDGILTKVARFVAWLTGIVSVIMITVGAFMYITSGGDANKVKTAKNIIIYAAVGLVVVALAQGIIAFIISRV